LILFYWLDNSFSPTNWARPSASIANKRNRLCNYYRALTLAKSSLAELRITEHNQDINRRSSFHSSSNGPPFQSAKKGPPSVKCKSLIGAAGSSIPTR